MNRRALLASAAAGLTAPVVARAQQGSSAVAKANANVVGVISGGWTARTRASRPTSRRSWTTSTASASCR
jgi:hypothetical protein